jgi:hypothetical protein
MIGVRPARRADYDVTLATSWRAFFAMFALPARGRASLILADESRRMAPGDPLRALVERSLREPGIHARGGPGEPRRRSDEVSIPGSGRATGDRACWCSNGQPATGSMVSTSGGRASCRFDAMPAVLRSCDALLDADDGGSGLAALEMQACGGR